MLFGRSNLASRTFVFILLVLIATSIYAAWIFSQVVFAKAPKPLAQHLNLNPSSLDFAKAPNPIAQHVPLNPPALDTHISVLVGSLEPAVLPPNRSNTPKSRPTDAGPTSNPFPLDVNVVLHNSSLCESLPDLRWVFYVHSAPANRAKRDLIRATWGDQRVHVPHTTQLVFMLGQTTDRVVQKSIETEHRDLGDIVQGDFLDTYRNLTLKAVMSLKWLTTHCNNATFFLKSDDDVLVNIFDYMNVAETAAQDHRRFIMCTVWPANAMRILRDPKTCSKWCVDPKEFPGQKFYPRYCSGIAITMSKQVLTEMYPVATKTPFFWIDDVFLTGLVAGKLKDVHYVDVVSTFNQPRRATNTTVTLMIHEHNAERYRKRWTEILRKHQLAGQTPTDNKALS